MTAISGFGRPSPDTHRRYLAADHGTKRGRQRGGGGHDPAGADPFGRRVWPVQHRHPGGREHPAADPCRIRIPTSSPKLSASPHSAEVRVKMTRAVRNTRLVPNRSPSHPEAGMKIARLTRKPMETPVHPVQRH
jgi:hypothetical protein